MYPSPWGKARENIEILKYRGEGGVFHFLQKPDYPGDISMNQSRQAEQGGGGEGCKNKKGVKQLDGYNTVLERVS